MTNAKTRQLRTFVGEVVSNKMEKSIVVRITRKVKHKRYGKYVRRFTKIHAHDESNECQMGDTVRICECRPIAKTKSWKLDQVIERAE